jgi:putative membrane protein
MMTNRFRTALVLAAALAAALALTRAPAARADGIDANADSVYMVGEFVDPVCYFQHGMLGDAARQCAMVRGRVEQGFGFLDIRNRRLYTVIGQNHWQDPRLGLLDALGDTVAIRARMWKSDGAAAIVVNAVYPVDRQPPAQYRWWPWRFEWSVLLGCALLAGLYLLGLTRLRARLGIPGRFETGRAALFMSSLLAMIATLDGPLHDLSDYYLFSAHMLQHLVLSLVVPPLFILGLPPWFSRWLLSRPWLAPWRIGARVPVGFVCYIIVFALWHAPGPYDLMMRRHGLHIVMHLMLMAAAVLLWWPIVAGEAVERRLSPGAQILYLFLISVPLLPVAAIITLADHPIYTWYSMAPRLFPISPLDDQRLGGLIMWIPGTLFWWGMMSVIYFRRLAGESRPEGELITSIPGTAVPPPLGQR